MKPSGPSPVPKRELRGLGWRLVLVWALVFLSRIWEPGLKLDAMTYAALAKHILATGDWLTLHYTPAAYADFYQHPPLVIWLQALVFKAFGASDLTARLLPACFGLGTVGITYVWGRRAGGPWLGFVAGIILLSSPRYVKFATDLFLDGPLAFWLMAGAYLVWTGILEPEKPSLRRAAGAGLCGAAAFMTKGLVALALPLWVGGAFILLSTQPGKRRSRMLALGAASLAAALPLGIWVAAGGGAVYLNHYFAESVRGRLAADSWREHLDPLWALIRTYWPWLPAFALGLTAMIARRPGTQHPLLRLAALLAIIIFGAFTYTGHYLDHYLVPFYPAAALVTASWTAPRLAPWRRPIARGVFALTAVLIIACAVLPVPLHSPRGEPLRSFVMQAEHRCHGQTQYLISGQAMERWMALAVVLWVTDRHARAVDDLNHLVPPQDALLVTHVGEAVGLGWVAVATAGPNGVASAGPSLQLYQPIQASLCL